jgi:hypothetical protein
VLFEGVGDLDAAFGQASQMGIFTIQDPSFRNL